MVGPDGDADAAPARTQPVKATPAKKTTKATPAKKTAKATPAKKAAKMPAAKKAAAAKQATTDGSDAPDGRRRQRSNLFPASTFQDAGEVDGSASPR